MCLRTEARRTLVAMAIAVVAALAQAPASAVQAPATGEPAAAEVERALDTVKKDPNLATDQTIKTLRWRESDTPVEWGDSAWWSWIGGMLRWFEQSTRYLIWAAAIVLAALVVVYIGRVMRPYQGPRDDGFVAPTHVRDLDIRPESLPADIGAAARRLWDRGEHRPALALLYRGLLSRLAHVHRVPIRDSSTEGDCLTLAAEHAPARTQQYVSTLVPTWQQFVYGARETAPTTVYGLCDDFSRALDRRAPIDPAAGGGPA